MKKSSSILIIDFGSQYTQLIARRVRELGVYCALYPYNITQQELEAFAPNGIILSGGPETVTLKDTPRAPEYIFNYGAPILGICYGMQTMAAQLGGIVESSHKKEFGYAELYIKQASPLFDQIQDRLATTGEPILDVWMSHADKVSLLPPGFHLIASTENTPIAAMADEQRHFYGILSHIEVSHTRQGKRILERFIYNICQCTPSWNTSIITEDLIQHTQEKVGKENVLVAISGGVDSAVLATLLHKAIGKQLTGIFVDNGLLRLHEADQLMQTLTQYFGMQIIRIDAAEIFLSALEGIEDPEQKRKIIGKVFIDVFEQEARKHSNIKWLAQGTIYSDVIESAKASFKSHLIKSHHNVAGLPAHLPFKLLEPLRELFKDEVRELGLALGLPYEMVYRHPFPGPGLGIRVLGEIKREYLELLRLADAIFIEELKKQNLYYQVNQAFAVLLPLKSVSVVGDARQYAPIIALRAVESTDFMTAQWANLPSDFLAYVAHRITNEVPHISRVVYDISNKPPSTIEWE